MRDGEPRHRDLVREALRHNNLDAASRDAVFTAGSGLSHRGSSFGKAHDFATKSKRLPERFSCLRSTQALLSIPEYIVERDR